MLRRLAIFFLLATAPAFAQTTAIRAGHVIDPATGRVSDNQIILVKDGKITAISSSVEIPKGAEVVDLSRSWVLPGLMDAHTHLTLAETPEDAAADISALYMKEGTGLRTLRGLRNAQQVLAAGFTTVRDVGNSGNHGDTDLRVAIERGWFPGPTIISTGKIIAPFGGQSKGIPPEMGRIWLFEYLDADTPEEVRKAVRENIFYGAKAIKLAANNSPYYYTEEEIHAAVEEAHRSGLVVAVHVYGGPEATAAIRAGVDSIEHGFQLTDEQLQLMKEKGTYLVGTDAPLAQLKIIGTAGGIFPPPEQNAKDIVDRLKRAHRIGVKMAFGTDEVLELPGRSRGDLMLEFLEVWLEAGIPPAKILQCMTTNAAELLRVQNERGSLSAGKAADIIAVPENPLERILALRRIHFVMKDGKIIRRPQ
jgi:imidazolonepropionase-like amidohydrolase